MGNELSHQDLFLTIPTAGRHPLLLKAIAENSGLPPDRTIIIRTTADADVSVNGIVIDDFEVPNIQRWWKRGIDESVARGATAVAVLNDDLDIGPHTLSDLHRALVTTGSTIATPSRQGLKLGVHRRRLIPYDPVIWGCLWMLDARTDLRPDPRYVWWYGDNDIDIRARRDYNGIVSCDVQFVHHHPGEGTSQSQALTQQSQRDAQTFEHDYARMLTLSRWYRRFRPGSQAQRSETIT